MLRKDTSQMLDGIDRIVADVMEDTGWTSSHFEFNEHLLPSGMWPRNYPAKSKCTLDQGLEGHSQQLKGPSGGKALRA